jgi:hypothetical protein
MRFFKATDATVYESIRLELDRSYGYPSAGAATSICPAATAPVDSSGKVYLMASYSECDYPVVASLLPALLATGSVEEVTQSDWDALFTNPG